MRGAGTVQREGDEALSSDRQSSSQTRIAAGNSRQKRHGEVISRSVSPPARQEPGAERQTGANSTSYGTIMYIQPRIAIR